MELGRGAGLPERRRRATGVLPGAPGRAHRRPPNHAPPPRGLGRALSARTSRPRARAGLAGALPETPTPPALTQRKVAAASREVPGFQDPGQQRRRRPATRSPARRPVRVSSPGLAVPRRPAPRARSLRVGGRGAGGKRAARSTLPKPRERVSWPGASCPPRAVCSGGAPGCLPLPPFALLALRKSPRFDLGFGSGGSVSETFLLILVSS